jgi:hypothetical protein
VRLPIIVTAAFLAACAPAPRPVEPPKPAAVPDRTTEEWYARAVAQLAAMNHDAAALLQRGKSDRAAAIVTDSQPVVNQLLSVPRPTLDAMEAVSDSDDLYGRMLLSNRHYGWARLAFQKNVTRWTAWRPQTPETARRLKLAAASLAECDRRLQE